MKKILRYVLILVLTLIILGLGIGVGYFFGFKNEQAVLDKKLNSIHPLKR